MEDTSFEFSAWVLVWEKSSVDGRWFSKVIPLWQFDQAKHKHYREF